MGRAEEADQQLEALYAQVPEIDCKRLCGDACGPIDCGPRERVRLSRAGLKLPSRRHALKVMVANGGEYDCPALVDGQCSVYALRPIICRVWGASELLRCHHGCKPANGRPLLTEAQALALLDAATKIGTSLEPMPPSFFEHKLSIPTFRRLALDHIQQPLRHDASRLRAQPPTPPRKTVKKKRKGTRPLPPFPSALLDDPALPAELRARLGQLRDLQGRQ